jgi:imidazolonepropionase
VSGGAAVSGDPRGFLIEGAAAVATLAGGLRRGPSQGDAAVLPGGALSVAAWEGRILAVGTEAEVHCRIEAQGLSIDSFDRLDAHGGLITPGLVDAHTHLLFAGTREVEWQMRARGAGYLEILAAGGGILSTVGATRAASDEELLACGRARLAQMLANGCWSWSTASAAKARWISCRRSSAPTPSPRSSVHAPTARRPTWPTSSGSSCRPLSARG